MANETKWSRNLSNTHQLERNKSHARLEHVLDITVDISMKHQCVMISIQDATKKGKENNIGDSVHIHIHIQNQNC